MHAGVERTVPQSILPTNEEGDKKSVSMSDGGGSMTLQTKVEIPELIARVILSE